MKLLLSAIFKFIIGLLLVGVLLFLPAGSFEFVNGWLFIGLFVPWIGMFFKSFGKYYSGNGEIGTPISKLNKKCSIRRADCRALTALLNYSSILIFPYSSAWFTILSVKPSKPKTFSTVRFVIDPARSISVTARENTFFTAIL